MFVLSTAAWFWVVVLRPPEKVTGPELWVEPPMVKLSTWQLVGYLLEHHCVAVLILGASVLSCVHSMMRKLRSACRRRRGSKRAASPPAMRRSFSAEDVRKNGASSSKTLE